MKLFKLTANALINLCNWYASKFSKNCNLQFEVCNYTTEIKVEKTISLTISKYQLFCHFLSPFVLTLFQWKCEWSLSYNTGSNFTLSANFSSLCDAILKIYFKNIVRDHTFTIPTKMANSMNPTTQPQK